MELEGNDYKISYKILDEFNFGDRDIKVFYLEDNYEVVVDGNYIVLKKFNDFIILFNSFINGNVVNIYDNNEVVIK